MAAMDTDNPEPVKPMAPNTDLPPAQAQAQPQAAANTDVHPLPSRTVMPGVDNSENEPRQGQQASPRQAAPTGDVQPAAQSEAPTVRQPVFIDPRPYVKLQQTNPKLFDEITQVAHDEGVNPIRLAAHAYVENRLNPNGPDSEKGAMGMMQVIPSTAHELDPSGKLDPRNPMDNLRLGARYIRKGDDAWGQDTAGSVMHYFGGPGTVNQFAANPDRAVQYNPKTVQYLRDITADHNVDGAIQGLKGAKQGSITSQGFQDAAQKGGPMGALQYIAANKASTASMSEGWRAVEGALQQYGIQHHDMTTFQNASQMVLQMSHQGSNQALMDASRALQMGDGVGAAKALAISHAFFPDDTMGKFGVDAKGNVFAQRFDEKSGSAMGGPIPIDQNGIMSMLNQHANPNDYLKSLMEQQKAAAANHLTSTHAQYYQDILGSRERIAAAANETKTTIGAGHDAARVDAATTRQMGKGGEGPLASTYKDANKRADELFNDTDGTALDGLPTAQHRAKAAEAFVDTMGMGANPVSAKHAAVGLASGKLGVRPQADGTYGVVDPKNPKAPPVAYLSAEAVRRLAPPPPTQQGAQTAPVGSASAPYNPPPSLAGTSQSAAVPTTPAPQSQTPTSPQPVGR